MKGLFPQGIAILARGPIPLAELKPLLPAHPFLKEVPASGDWTLAGETAVIAYRPEINGYISLDTVPQPWPDHMGSPKEEPTLFTAWGMGQFGPHTFPGNLQRATEQAWHWPEARDQVPAHRAFLRLRLSYVFGAGPDARVWPEGRDPRHELEFLLALAEGLLKHPAAICGFNPGGEVVIPAPKLRESLAYHAQHGIPPFNLWSNVRLFNLNPEWIVMDTVGNGQLDMPDHEAAFPKDRFNPGEVSGFLRNASLYIFKNGEVVKNNDTMNGPGGVDWQAVRFEEPLSAPPRRVYCWIPRGEKNVPEAITKRKIAPDPTPATTSASVAATPAKDAPRRPAARPPWWRLGR